MVTTNNAELAAKLRLFRGQGMDPERRYWFSVVGYNYRMTNIQAAIGLAQMETVENALLDRQKLAEQYHEALADLQGAIILPKQEPWAKHVYWMYTIFLREGQEETRDSIIAKLDEAGIETHPVFYPLHHLPPYQEATDYPMADRWAGRGINLPTHQGLTQSDVSRIAESLKKALL